MRIVIMLLVVASSLFATLSCTTPTSQVSLAAPKPVLSDGFVTYFSRPEIAFVTVTEISLDGLGCGAEALQAAEKLARRYRGDAMIVDCMGARGRVIPWESAAVKEGTWLRATIIRFPWLWSSGRG